VDIPLDLVLRIGTIAIACAVAVLGTKYAINGLKEDVAECRASLEKLLESDAEQSAEIAAIKATATLQQSWMERLESWVSEGFRDRRSGG
jgi:precorrin-4 methylase